MMCEFCEESKPLEDEYDNYEAKIVRLIPLPPINLTTGKYESELELPYYALFIYDQYDGRSGEIASIPIKYCPICGRRLLTEGDVAYQHDVIQHVKENK